VSTFEDTVCIIRTFNNAIGPTLAAVRRAFANGIARVILVVNDEDGGHRESFSDQATCVLQEEFKGRLWVIRIQDGYGWASAFNAAFVLLRSWDLVPPRFPYVLFASTPVEWTSGHLSRMRRAMAGLRGAVASTFSGVRGRSRETCKLGRMYAIPRFTFVLMRWSAIVQTGGVDTASDAFGGMEDIDYFIRLLATTPWQIEFLQLGVPVVIDEFEDPEEKEARCERAAGRVIQRLLQLACADEALCQRVLQAIRSLGLVEYVSMLEP
jgi:hypothetical protein